MWARTVLSRCRAHRPCILKFLEVGTKEVNKPKRDESVYVAERCSVVYLMAMAEDVGVQSRISGMRKPIVGSFQLLNAPSELTPAPNTVERCGHGPSFLFVGRAYRPCTLKVSGSGYERGEQAEER
jgi:hypothetical protein